MHEEARPAEARGAPAGDRRTTPRSWVAPGGTARAPGGGMRRVLVFTTCALASAWALLACGSKRTPEPPFTGQPTSALVEVPYPPPPARVEILPPRPRADAVWIDGEWVWQGGTWAWRTGRWAVVPAGAAWAPWTTVRSEAGILYAAEGRFRRPDGTEVPAPLVLAVGKPRGGPVVTPEGEVLERTPGAGRDEGPDDAAIPPPPEWDAGFEPLDAMFDDDVIPLPAPPDLRNVDAAP